jgi:hypothetical protein
MNNAQAIVRFEVLDNKILQGAHLGLEQAEEYRRLRLLLEAGLRRCAYCGSSEGQSTFIISFGKHWIHVDCAHDYSVDCKVDPTTQRLGESDEDYSTRMKEFRNQKGLRDV